MEQNVADYETKMNGTKRQREAADARMVLRRRKMCTLCEELSVRTHRLQPVMKRMQQIGQRLKEIKRELTRLRRSRRDDSERELLQRELDELQDMLLETPEEFQARL